MNCCFCELKCFQGGYFLFVCCYCDNANSIQKKMLALTHFYQKSLTTVKGPTKPLLWGLIYNCLNVVELYMEPPPQNKRYAKYFNNCNS